MANNELKLKLISSKLQEIQNRIWEVEKLITNNLIPYQRIKLRAELVELNKSYDSYEKQQDKLKNQ